MRVDEGIRTPDVQIHRLIYTNRGRPCISVYSGILGNPFRARSGLSATFRTQWL